MDELHEHKARWLKWSFRLLVVAFAGLMVQGAVLAVGPPSPPTSAAPTRIVIEQPPP